MKNLTLDELRNILIHECYIMDMAYKLKQGEVWLCMSNCQNCKDHNGNLK